MRPSHIIIYFLFVILIHSVSGCAVKPVEIPVQPPMADTIYSGGTILTIDESQPRAEAIAVKDGKILAVGKLADVLVYNGGTTRVVDLKESTLIPGFIDTGSHLSDYLDVMGSPDLSPPPAGTVQSIENIIEQMTEHITKKAIPEGTPVIGYNYDDSLLTERRHPTREDLDMISTSRPVCLLHISGHIAACNSLALEQMGYTSDTPDPKGGLIVRDENDIPTGILEERALSAVFPLITSKNGKTRMSDLMTLLSIYAGSGITTVHGGPVSSDSFTLLKKAANDGNLMLDVVCYPEWSDFKTITASDVHVGTYSHHLKTAGVSLAPDGTLQGKTAWLGEPYYLPPTGQPVNYQGYPVMTQSDLNTAVENLYNKGYQPVIHCNGDACTDMVIKAIDSAGKKHENNGLRPVVSGALSVRKNQIAEMAALNIRPSFFVSQTYFWGDWYRDSVLGPERAANISPMRWALDQKMIVAIHNETPAVQPDMLTLIWSAVTRTTRSGKVLGDHHRITPMEAMKAVTIMAANHYSEESIKGSLEPGKLADLVILSGNPLTVEPDAIRDIKVLTTIKEGNVVWDSTKQ